MEAAKFGHDFGRAMKMTTDAHADQVGVTRYENPTGKKIQTGARCPG